MRKLDGSDFYSSQSKHCDKRYIQNDVNCDIQISRLLLRERHKRLITNSNMLLSLKSDRRRQYLDRLI